MAAAEALKIQVLKDLRARGSVQLFHHCLAFLSTAQLVIKLFLRQSRLSDPEWLAYGRGTHTLNIWTAGEQ